MIPTVTNHCKKILFSGKKYDNIIKNKSYIDELKNFFINYKVNNVSNIDDIDDNADINIYEILEVDENIHNSKGITMEYLKNILHHRMKIVLEYIKDKDINVVVCSDHGFLDIKKRKAKSIEFKRFLNEKNLDLESHGRYMSISGLYFDKNIYNILIENLLEKNFYHIITRDQLKDYYLKDKIGNKEIYCYLMYKGSYVSTTNTGEYTHGGITLEEVMIPFAILGKETIEYIPVELEIMKSQVIAGEKSEITVLIKNKNEIDYLEASLFYNGANKKINNIQGNRQITIPVTIKKVGIIPEKLIIKIKVYGEYHKIELDIDIKSVESKKSKISKKLKKSRSLL